MDAAHGNVASIINSFATSAETTALYGPINNTTIGGVIDSIYMALFNRAPDAAGKQFYVDGFAKGDFTAGSIALAVLNGAQNSDQAAINNKVAVAQAFAAALDTPVEVNAYAGDAAAQTARDLLASVVSTTNPATFYGVDNAIQQIVNGSVEHVFTLKNVDVAYVPPTTAIYWGYNPHDNTSASGAPADGGIPVADLLKFLTSITGLTFAELGVIDPNTGNPFQNVTNLTLSNPLSSTGGQNANNGGSNQLTITYADGTTLTTEAKLGTEYFDFLNGLLFDKNGNTRLYEKVISSGSSGETAPAIKLTGSVNNGGTVEQGFTTAGDDTIVAGRLDLLHGAYIDGGAGYNILEVDAKGQYAQPLQLLNIQEVRVNDLPNFYTDASGNDHYPDLTNQLDPTNNDSWLDLSRATAIKRLVVTDESANSGNLTIVGVRNAATLRLEGGFAGGDNSLTVQYGQGQTGTLNLELAVGTVDGTINLLQNASVLNIDSQGVENHLNHFFAGGNISRMIVTGTGVFSADGNIASSFNAGRPAIIDASANTGGLDIELDGHYNLKVTGTQADDEIIATGSTKVVIAAGNGDNTIKTDGSQTVSITAGTGADTISAKNGETVVIDAQGGNNVIDASQDVNSSHFGAGNVSITTGSGNDVITAVRNDSVTINAGDGANKIEVSANTINITTGAGNDKLVLSGMDTVFPQGDNVSGDNTDNYPVVINGVTQPGALLNIDVGGGTNTIVLGRDPFGVDTGAQFGITALEGSSITGSNISLFVENNSNLTQATLTGITNVTLKQELTITADQFSSIGAAAFNVYHAAFGATEDLHIVVSSDTTLSSLVDLTKLSTNVRLSFELHNGATLTLSAEELSKYVAVNGIHADDGLNGKVVITSAGENFDPFNSGDSYQVITGGTVAGGSLDNLGVNVTIVRTANGYERPAPAASTDTLTIDSDGTPVVGSAVISEAQTLKIVGGQNLTFNKVVDLGGEAALKGADNVFGQTINGVTQSTPNGTYIVATGDLKAESDGFTVDFSALTGTMTGLTLDHFQDVKQIIGNNTGTRIDVKLNADVGAPGVGKGLNTSGVAEYVVTSIDTDQDGAKDSGSTVVVNLCDLTKDVTTIGLQGNVGNTLKITGVPWGVVAPHILLEGDHLANWSDEVKANGNPDTSNIGTVEVDYFAAGAPAIIDINNGGVALGTTSTGGERKFAIDGIKLLNAVSATVNVTDGDAVIASIADVAVTPTLKTLTITATEDVTVTADLPDSLNKIDASAVTGVFTATIDHSEVAHPVDFTFVGGAGGTVLSLDDVVAGTQTSIDGGPLGATLKVSGDVELDNATLANVAHVVLANGADLSLNFTEFAAIGAANITVVAGTFDLPHPAGTLNLVGLSNQPFSVTNLTTGVNLGTVTLATDAVVTLDPATDLTGVDALVLHKDQVLNLTAAQYQELVKSGNVNLITVENGEKATVNITGLTQADVAKGFDTSHISSQIDLSLTLAEDVNFPLDQTVPVAKVLTNLAGVDTINVGDNLTLGLPHVEDGSGVKIVGGTNSTVVIHDATLGLTSSIDASGFDVDSLQVLNTLVGGHNIDEIFAGLSARVIKTVTNGEGNVLEVDQTVNVTAGTTVPQGLDVFKTENNVEVQNLTVNLLGGTDISGDLGIASVSKDPLLHTHLQSLTINSTGTATNILSGKSTNIIAGDIDPFAGLGTVDNNLLNVTINATQALQVGGSIKFSSVVGDDAVTGNDDYQATATLNVTGSADVTIAHLDVTDTEVSTLAINTTSTGTLTVTGGSAALLGESVGPFAMGPVTNHFANLVFSGTGNVVLGDADTSTPQFGIEGDNLSKIDASALSGNLNLGQITDINSENFAFTSGTGVTKLTLTNDVLDKIKPTDTGWSFDLTNAAAGSELHLGSSTAAIPLNFQGGALNVKLGANATLYIDGLPGSTVDLTALDSVSITGAKSIVLAAGVHLVLTAAEANGLHIVADPSIVLDKNAVGYDASKVPVVDIVNLDTAATDLSGIESHIAGTVTLKEAANPTYAHQADVALAAATDLGSFSVTLNDVDSLVGTDNEMAGQTIRFATATQAQRKIIVVGADSDAGTPWTGAGDGSLERDTNVVWNFNTINTANGKIDTSGYAASLGRVWVNDALVNGKNVEDIFSSPSAVQTNPTQGIINLNSTTIIRIANTADLSTFTNNENVNRTVEVDAFTSLPAGLVFNNADKLVGVQNLTLDLGGAVTLGAISVDDIVAANIANNNSFGTLTINSKLAGPVTDTYLLPQGFDPLKNTYPTAHNVVGDISSGASRGELTSVVIHATGVELDTGTVKFNETTNATTNPTKNSTAGLVVDGSKDVTVKSVDATDTDLTVVNVINAGTADLTVTGASPAVQLGTAVETLNVAATNGGTITLGKVDATTGAVINAGVAGQEVSFINTAGTVDLGTLAQIDSTNDDRNHDGDTTDFGDAAFTLTAGVGSVTKAKVGAANGLTPTLNAHSEWVFDYTSAAVGSSLTLTSTASLQQYSTLDLINVPLIIDGAVDLSQLIDDAATASVTEGLQVTGGSITVIAGATLTLTAAQADVLRAAGVQIYGAGTLKLTGDASNLTLGANIHTATVDISGVTLVAAPAVGADADNAVDLTALAGSKLTAADPAFLPQTIVGSPSDDLISTTANGANVISGNGGNDTINVSATDHHNTINVTSGTDAVVGVQTGDVLVVSSGATANVTASGPFIASSATSNNGTATITGTAIDVSHATGSNGFTVLGTGLAPSVLIGSAQADVINGGNKGYLGGFDTLTGSGGADTFVFDVHTSTPATLTTAAAPAPVAAVDQETITINTDGLNNNPTQANVTINYTVNSTIAAVVVDLSHVDLTSKQAVTTSIAAALDAIPGVDAKAEQVAGVWQVTAQGTTGGKLDINSLTPGGADIGALTFNAVDHATGDVAQQNDIAISGPANAIGEVYNITATLADGTTIVADYAANALDMTLPLALNADIALKFNTLAAGKILATATATGIHFADLVADDGGYTLSFSSTGAIDGSGASKFQPAALPNPANYVDALDLYQSADIVTDFTSGTDHLKLNVAAGTSANYKEAAAATDISTALINANLNFAAGAGTVQYYLGWVTAHAVDGTTSGTTIKEGDTVGVLFVDSNKDGTADMAVRLVGVDGTKLDHADIVA
ncbi:MAG: hypothetical protein JSR83_14395 [Proteobacteria bacterium]|nr:hypothetical protein [Pseudomonadota bacterium]